MKNEKVFTQKLKLPEKYLTDPHIKLMLEKPGTLSKKEKQWLKDLVTILSVFKLFFFIKYSIINNNVYLLNEVYIDKYDTIL